MDPTTALLCASLVCNGHSYELNCRHAMLLVDSIEYRLPCCPTGTLIVSSDGTAYVTTEELNNISIYAVTPGDTLARSLSNPACDIQIPTPTPTPLEATPLEEPTTEEEPTNVSIDNNTSNSGCNIHPSTALNLWNILLPLLLMLLPKIAYGQGLPAATPAPTRTPHTLMAHNAVRRFGNQQWVFMSGASGKPWRFKTNYTSTLAPPNRVTCEDIDPFTIASVEDYPPIHYIRPGQKLIKLALTVEQWGDRFDYHQDAIDYLFAFVGAMNGVYERELGISFKITAIQLWFGAPPYNPTYFDDSWIAWWDANYPPCTAPNTPTNCIDRDIMLSVHMNDSNGGKAWLGGLCDTGYAYAWCDLGRGTRSSDIATCIHEIGHLLNMCHTHDLTPRIDCCGGQCNPEICPIDGLGATFMSYCYGLNCPPPRYIFHERNKAQARERLNDPDSCIPIVGTDCRSYDPTYGGDYDVDMDSIPNGCDNCPLAANLNQQDSDDDGQGDACETPACNIQARASVVVTPFNFLLLIPILIYLSIRSAYVKKHLH